MTIFCVTQATLNQVEPVTVTLTVTQHVKCHAVVTHGHARLLHNMS